MSKQLLPELYPYQIMESCTLFGKSAEFRELKHINEIGEGIIGPESRVALSKAGKFSLTPCSRDAGLIHGLGRSPGGNGNPLQYSYLGNPIDRGAWRATVHRVKNNQTRLSLHTHTHTHTQVLSNYPSPSLIPKLHQVVKYSYFKFQ